MFKAIYCFLTGQHEYAITCEPGSIFLQCRTCGQRSKGWAMHPPAGLRPARAEAVGRLEPHVHAREHRQAA